LMCGGLNPGDNRSNGKCIPRNGPNWINLINNDKSICEPYWTLNSGIDSQNNINLSTTLINSNQPWCPVVSTYSGKYTGFKNITFNNNNNLLTTPPLTYKYGSTGAQVPMSRAICENYCENNNNCVAYELDVNNTTCKLLNSVTNSVASNNNMAYVKTDKIPSSNNKIDICNDPVTALFNSNDYITCKNNLPWDLLCYGNLIQPSINNKTTTLYSDQSVQSTPWCPLDTVVKNTYQQFGYTYIDPNLEKTPLILTYLNDINAEIACDNTPNCIGFEVINNGNNKYAYNLLKNNNSKYSPLNATPNTNGSYTILNINNITPSGNIIYHYDYSYPSDTVFNSDTQNKVWKQIDSNQTSFKNCQNNWSFKIRDVNGVQTAIINNISNVITDPYSAKKWCMTKNPINSYYEFDNYDYTTGNSIGTITDNISGCQDYCDSDTNCLGFSFDTTNNNCNIKSSLTGGTTKSGINTYVKSNQINQMTGNVKTYLGPYDDYDYL